MWWRRVTGALLCLALAGCTGSPAPEARPPAEGPRPELDGWEPPAGAPEFCDVLARSEHVREIPGAVGRLTADPGDPQPAWRLTQSSVELRDARDAALGETGHADLTAALDDLVEALLLAASGELDQATNERIADGLAAVGRYAQEPCRFPT